MSRPLKLAFILDPLAGLKAYKDSSIAMMRAAAARGHTVYAIGREALSWRAGAVAAKALRIRLSDDDRAWYEPGEAVVTVLSDFDAVVMRQDPPFDFEYITAT